MGVGLALLATFVLTGHGLQVLGAHAGHLPDLPIAR
jgi:hypothetical protein